MQHLMITLTVQSRGEPEGTLEGEPNDELSNIHKDAQEGAFQVALGLHLWLHLLMQSLIYKFVKNGSFSGGPDAALEGALDGGLDGENIQEGDKKDALDVLLDNALKYEHSSAVEGALDDSSEGTPTFEVSINGEVEITIELHLKIQMVMNMLVQKNAQNDSIKCELEEALYFALEDAH